MHKPQVLPPLLETISISVPSGLKRNTPEPMPVSGLSGAPRHFTFPAE